MDQLFWDTIFFQMTQLLWDGGNIDYFVLLNGNIVGPIISSRGFRQGDSIPPYLFIICA